MCPLTSVDSSLSLIDSNLIKIALNVLDPSGCCSCSLCCYSPQLFCALSVLFARVRESTRRLGNLTFLSLPRASFSPCSYLNEFSQPPMAAYPRPGLQSLLSTPDSFKFNFEGKERRNSHRALHWNWSSDTDAEFSKSKRIVDPCPGRCPILTTTWIILKLSLESISAARCNHCPVLTPVLWWRALAQGGLEHHSSVGEAHLGVLGTQDQRGTEVMSVPCHCAPPARWLRSHWGQPHTAPLN